MRVAIMGTGAVGGYFGARLAAAGHDVTFIARGSHLAAIRANGLKIDSVLGDLHLPHPQVTDDPATVGPVDIVLFAVKLWDTETAGNQARPMVGPETRLITVQNGIDSVERLVPILGADAVVGGTAQISAVIASPGVIKHSSQFARITCGRSDGRPDPKLKAFVDSARQAGIDFVLSDAIELDRWRKFVLLVGVSGATAAMRMSSGPILTDPDTRAFYHALMSEVVAVGLAKGIPLAPDFADDRLKFALASPTNTKASMCHDLERGNRLEVDWLAGRVVELGRTLGVPTPMNAAVYAILKLHRMGRTVSA